MKTINVLGGGCDTVRAHSSHKKKGSPANPSSHPHNLLLSGGRGVEVLMT